MPVSYTHLGFPGMKVLEFAFDPREERNYLPYTYNSNSVVYVGTHDNNTVLGWIDELDEDTLCLLYTSIAVY